MNSEGSSAFNFAPAAENFFAALEEGDRNDSKKKQLPSLPDSRGWGYTNYDNYLVQGAQGVISTPDAGPLYPHTHPQNPAVAGPALPSSLAPVGFASYSTNQQLNPPTTNYRPFALPHQDDTSYNWVTYNNSPAWSPDSGARIDDGSSPSSLALSSPPEGSPPSAAGREKPHECVRCGRRFAMRRDLQRHENTSHKSDETPMYICWCGVRGSATSRKDNYLRHVHSCNRQPVNYECYNCICGLFGFGKDVHLDHVLHCGRTRSS